MHILRITYYREHQARHKDGGQALIRRGSHPIRDTAEKKKIPYKIVDTFVRISLLSRSEPSRSKTQEF